MDHFKFVFLHSAYLLPFALGFLFLGFLYGFFHWQKWRKRLAELQHEADELQRLRIGANQLNPAAGTPNSEKEISEEFKFNDIYFD